MQNKKDSRISLKVALLPGLILISLYLVDCHLKIVCKIDQEENKECLNFRKKSLNLWKWNSFFINLIENQASFSIQIILLLKKSYLKTNMPNFLKTDIVCPNHIWEFKFYGFRYYVMTSSQILDSSIFFWYDFGISFFLHLWTSILFVRACSELVVIAATRAKVLQFL